MHKNFGDTFSCKVPSNMDVDAISKSREVANSNALKAYSDVTAVTLRTPLAIPSSERSANAFASRKVFICPHIKYDACKVAVQLPSAGCFRFGPCFSRFGHVCCFVTSLLRMTDPTNDHGFIYNDQGKVDIIKSPFFNFSPDVDHSVEEYVDRIIFQLAVTIDEQISSVQWLVGGNTKKSTDVENFSMQTNSSGDEIFQEEEN
ncbi:hypothetical protein M5K25_025401 [Dendrobium thyrsiflorum]|uniref:Uncharacterized protein n=1 Tax=Dendrobium thyrsiflorum TaxID=117978 RepID=A0ABD0U435_DENTH